MYFVGIVKYLIFMAIFFLAAGLVPVLVDPLVQSTLTVTDEGGQPVNQSLLTRQNTPRDYPKISIPSPSDTMKRTPSIMTILITSFIARELVTVDRDLCFSR